MNKETSSFQCVSTQHASYRYKHVTKSQVFSWLRPAFTQDHFSNSPYINLTRQKDKRHVRTDKGLINGLFSIIHKNLAWFWYGWKIQSKGQIRWCERWSVLVRESFAVQEFFSHSRTWLKDKGKKRIMRELILSFWIGQFFMWRSRICFLNWCL